MRGECLLAQKCVLRVAGIILVAINPYEQLPIYGEDVIDAYSGQNMADMDPHIFSVAEEAYRQMAREEQNQSIIISGESGAGKTVSAKFTMRYFAAVGGSARKTSVEERVLESNPIMEAIGNAKTTRNDNSSRFGKYIEIGFGRKGDIIGANMRTYLLEKSRVVFQTTEERNYHIFYQLCASRHLPELSALGLRRAEEFQYTSQGGNVQIPGTDDAADLERTRNSFSVLGVRPGLQMELFRILAAILHLGDVRIQSSGRDGERCSVNAEDRSLHLFCQLLAVERSQMAHWLCHRRLAVAGEMLVKPMGWQQACEARDALSKHVYRQLFTWTVGRLNGALRAQRRQPHSFIGVLDIYGFETFEKNSFEQFCINYANEKLQQQFNRVGLQSFVLDRFNKTTRDTKKTRTKRNLQQEHNGQNRVKHFNKKTQRREPQAKAVKGRAEEFQYTSQGGNVQIPGTDDAADLERTRNSFSVLGVRPGLQMELFRILAAILHLGDVRIQSSGRDGERCSVNAEDRSLHLFCQLLAVERSQMAHWLCHRRLAVAGEMLVKPMGWQQACEARDALSKHVYGQLFTWTVGRLNGALRAQRRQPHSFIGVLDIYGFETFEKNSFEQFCINYANEKLQQQFNRHVFQLEQEEYLREEIPWTRIEFSDNQPCIELIEGKLGVLDLLDEECRMPKGSDESWAQKLYERHQNQNPHFSKPRLSNTAFIILHFADTSELVAELFQDESGGDGPPLPGVTTAVPNGSLRSSRKGGSTVRREHKQTVGFQSVRRVLYPTRHSAALLSGAHLYSGFRFDPKRAVQQLRACGVLETIRISAAGYPSRWTYSEFFKRYRVMMQCRDPSLEDRQAACRAALGSLIPDPDQYRFGKTKIFFRAGQVALLEKLAHSLRYTRAALVLQKSYRMVQVRRLYLLIRSAAVTIQAFARGALARCLYRQLRAERKAVLLQARVRGWSARRAFLRVRGAVLYLQCCYRRMRARRELKQRRMEARSVEHYRQLNKGMEVKLMQLQRRADEQSRESSLLKERLSQERAAHCTELARLQGELSRLAGSVQDEARSTALAQELSALRGEREREREERRSAEQRAAQEITRLTQAVESLQREKAALIQEREKLNTSLQEHERAREERLSQQVALVSSGLRAELEEERGRYQGLLKEFSRLEQRYENLKDEMTFSERFLGHRRNASSQSLILDISPPIPAGSSEREARTSVTSPERQRRATVTSPDLERRVTMTSPERVRRVTVASPSSPIATSPADSLLKAVGLFKDGRMREEDLRHAYDAVRVANKFLESQLVSQRQQWDSEMEALRLQVGAEREEVDRQSQALAHTLTLPHEASLQLGLQEQLAHLAADNLVSGVRFLESQLVSQRQQWDSEMEALRLQVGAEREEVDRQSQALAHTLTLPHEASLQLGLQEQLAHLAADNLESVCVSRDKPAARATGTTRTPGSRQPARGTEVLSGGNATPTPHKEVKLQGLLECRREDEARLIKNLITARGTEVLSGGNATPAPHKEVKLQGLLECRREDEARLIKNLITGLRPEVTRTLTPGLPAHILFLCMRQADWRGEEQRARALCTATVTAIKGALKSSQTDEQTLLTFDPSDLRKALSDLSIQTYQQLIRIAESRLQPMIGEPGKEWSSQTDEQTLLTFDPSDLRKALSDLSIQTYQQLIRIAESRLQPMIGEPGKEYNVSQLEDWLRGRSLQLGGAVDSLEPLIQAAQLLQVSKRSESDARAIEETCTALSPPQIVKILSLYTPLNEFEERVTLNFIRSVQIVKILSLYTPLNEFEERVTLNFIRSVQVRKAPWVLFRASLIAIHYTPFPAP
ncbi:UNVERIFIED_CONTAM: hypothetical protein FKN15_074205 [Acipenser sinensis]